MSTGSTLVAVKSTLVTRMKARPGLAGVGVHYAYPGDFAEGRDGDDIWLGMATAEHQPMAMRGGARLPTQEDYRLTLCIQSLKFMAKSQETADLRSVQMLAEVQQELATTPQITAEVLIVELAGWRHVPGPFATVESAYGSRFELEVRVRARLA